MKILFETSDFGEALVVRAKLEQAGFLVHLDNYNWGCAEPYMGMALGYRVWGAAIDHDEAKILIQPVSGVPEDYDPLEACHSCKSDAVIRYRSLIWTLIFVLIHSYLLPPGGNKRRCIDCGHRYKEKGPAITGPMKIVLAIWIIFIAFVFATGNEWSPNIPLPVGAH